MSIFNDVDKWQKKEDTEWRWEESKGIYRAELNGEVLYFSYRGFFGSDDGGYGGWEFKVVMKDGSVRDIKGPWASRAECVNAAFPQYEKLDESYTCQFGKGVLQKIYE